MRLFSISALDNVITSVLLPNSMRMNSVPHTIFTTHSHSESVYLTLSLHSLQSGENVEMCEPFSINGVLPEAL